jgi:hypothetical protein
MTWRRMKNPHLTPEQEAQIERAERLGTRATIFQLGAAQYLKTHMPCGSDVEEVRAVLVLSTELRKQCIGIHNTIDGQRSRKLPKAIGSKKAKNKGEKR